MHGFVNEPIYDSISVLLRALEGAVWVCDPQNASPQAMQALIEQEVLLRCALVYAIDRDRRGRHDLGYRQLDCRSIHQPRTRKNDLDAAVHATTALQQSQRTSTVDIKIVQGRSVA